MLEMRNISKTYRAKAGVSVRALDRVSLTFGETGMIFLLGKSGSGKSTLLNVIGGLDSFDEGEVIIKGRSSKKFKKSDFDAYRNTFIGFIFQEYNILDEFSVGANIALALELQGKKATDEAINNILEQVELLDYANRKPNELSGGQKQRIAIARALIKEPEIIMADEPTGALDSTTGKQVLETLKKLSKTKLVLVVSHDREFAETYGDRIIELADGRVISDMTQTVEENEVLVEEAESAEEAPVGVTVVDDSIIHISRGYTLTLEDMDIINAYLRRGDRDVILSKDEEVNEGVRVAKGIVKARKKEKKRVASGRHPTGAVETKSYNPADTKFIKSRLPIRNATKIAAASMKAKPVRLVFTIFLSLVAFFTFGLADTMASYNQLTATVDSLQDSKMTNVALSLYLRQENQRKENGEWIVQNVYYSGQSDNFNEDDIEYLKEFTGLDFKGVYRGSDGGFSLSSMLSSPSNLVNKAGNTLYPYHSIGGITELTEEEGNSMGFTLLGDSRYPENQNEILITEYIFRMMNLAGVTFGDYEILPDYLNATAGDPDSILGRRITMYRREFTIVGVVDTCFDYDNERYAPLQPNYSGATDSRDAWDAQNSLEYNELPYSYHTLAIGFAGLIETLPKPSGGVYKENGASFMGNESHFMTVDKDGEGGYNIYLYRAVGNEKLDQFRLVWIDANQTELRAKEIMLPINYCYNNLYASDLGYSMEYRLIPQILRDLVEYREQYTMWQWIYDSTYNDLYLEKTKDTNPLSYEEYRGKICEFYNAYFGVNLPTEGWMTFAGHVFDQHHPTTMSIEEYSKKRADLKLIESSLDKIYTDCLTVGTDFYNWLCEGNEGTNPLVDYVGDDLKIMTLNYVYLYVSNAKDQKLFGSEKSMSKLRYDEYWASIQLAEDYYNELFGVELSYDNWLGLLGNCHYPYFKGYTEYMTFGDYVKQREAFRFVLDNFDAVKAEFLDKDSLFARWLADFRPIENDPDKDYAELLDDEYEVGKLIANAMIYVCDYTDSSRPMFGKDFTTLYNEKLVEYAIAGVSQLNFPQLYHGYDQYLNDGSSNRVIEKNIAYNVVGFFVPENNNQDSYVLSEDLYKKAESTHSDEEYKNVVGHHTGGRYVMVLALLPEGNREVLEALASLHTREEGQYEFRMKNSVTEAIDQWGETIQLFSKIFFYVGIGFAVFAALMMLNFISASVTYKKKEIGILRAIGARSSDVFAIFFSEAFFIALINFVLASAGILTASYFINDAVRNELGFPITLLHTGIRQVLLVFGVSMVVAFVGSFFPVRKIARKNPIDAMKDR